MKYRAFKRIDQKWSIIDQDSGQTLNLVLPNEELAKAACKELNDVYQAAYKDGYADRGKSK